MGQELSQHELFVQGLKEALRTREVEVKVKQLLTFLDSLKDACPWFPQEGTIDEKRWKRVGDTLKRLLLHLWPRKGSRNHIFLLESSK